MAQPKLPTKQRLTIGELNRRGLDYFRYYAPEILKAIAPVALPIALAAGIYNAVIADQIYDYRLSVSLFRKINLFVQTALLIFSVFASLSSAMAFVSLHKENGLLPSAQQVWDRVSKNAVRLSVAAVVVAAVYGAIVVWLFPWLDKLIDFPLIAFILIILPVILLSGRLAFTLIFLSQHQLSLISAIKRSIAESKGFGGRVSSLIFFQVLIILAAGGLMVLPGFLIGIFLQTHDVSEGSAITSIVRFILQVIEAIIPIFLFALASISVFYIYHDTVERKNATTLAKYIDAIGENQTELLMAPEEY